MRSAVVSKKGGVGANYVYGVHAVRSLIDKRPEAILKASVLKGSRAGTIPELTRRLENIGITVEPKQRSELDQMSNGGDHRSYSRASRSECSRV